MSVPKLANARLLNKSRYFSGMAWDIARPRLCGIYRSLDYRRTERLRDNGCRPMSFGRRLMNSQQISRPLLLCLCVLLFAILPCAWAQKGSAPPTIVFMTDFGTVDDSVAICKGVMYSIAPEARIVDLTHQVTPFSILDGARYLFGATPYYPAGTVFTVVIDPGVGSTRKAVILESKRGQYFVLPDNGLITLVADRDGLAAAREITNPAWMIGKALSSTFHGRDIFSPAGAHLARGDDWTQAGSARDLKSLVRLDLQVPRLDAQGLHGEIIATDGPF